MGERLKKTVLKVARMAVLEDRQKWITRGLWAALAVIIAGIAKWLMEAMP